MLAIPEASLVVMGGLELISLRVAIGLVIVILSAVPYVRSSRSKSRDAKRVSSFCLSASGTLPGTRFQSQLLGKKVLAIVNPKGGSRKALDTYNRILKPMCDALRIDLRLMVTTHAGHARQIAQEISDETSLLICLSGDGMLHEAVNGLVHNKKMRLPIAIIPCGSSNGISKSIYGTVDPFEAARVILLGEKRVCSLVSVEPLKGAGTVEYDLMGLTHAGVMDVIEITEVKLRWMNKLPLGGLMKDMIAAMWVIGYQKRHGVRVQLQAAPITDTELSALSLYGYTVPKSDASNAYRSKLVATEPPAGCGTEHGASWYQFEDDCVWCEAMNCPWIAYDMQPCPGLTAADPHMNLLTSRGHSRWQLLQSFLKIEDGKHVHDPWMDRYKVCQLVITRANLSSGFAMSGEQIRFGEEQAVLAKCNAGHALLWY